MKTLITLTAGCLLASNIAMAKVNTADIKTNYANIAHAVFEDALITAKSLQDKTHALLANPSSQALENAKAAWKAARAPYQQSEVFRFGNPNVDDWEGQLNAWPLDEGLIDYVDASYEHEMGNIGATVNIIANTKIRMGDQTIDATHITPTLLADLNELAGSEANVATGYHAIEFLLWGQDLNGTKPGAGERPYTDYAVGKACTHGNCDRRGAYLKAAVQLLVSDLENMVAQWAPGSKDNYRAQLLAESDLAVMKKMLYGMGSLSLGELAGERLKVALEANSTEDEHDCFSDNTHYSHYYDAKGIDNVYKGRYVRVDNRVVKGASLQDLVAEKNTALNQQVLAALGNTEQALTVMVNLAEAPKNPMKFDQMIAPGNEKGKQTIAAVIGALVAQTRLIEQAAKAIGIENLNPDTADHDF